MALEATLDYQPRNAFIPFHQRQNRFAAMVCHRRAGKTVACIYDLVLRAMYTKKKRAKYAYVGPFRQQAKEIAWEYLKEATEGIRKGAPRESDLRVTLPNGATISLYGADNPDALRGVYFDGVILDEYGDQRPSIWGEVILPTLMDRKGWAVFIGTMRGKNHFYKTLQRAKENEKWHYMMLKASESGLLSEEDLDEARSEMSEAQYAQEMECDADAAVQGTYYANIIAQMERDGKIKSVPWNPDEMVHCSADLGFTDSTAFWFWQYDEEGKPRVIDYEEADGQKLQFYFDMLDDKGYEYADIWLPHDAKATTLQTGVSTIEQFLGAGFPCKMVPKLAIQHGIDASRLLLPDCVIDKENCDIGVEALRAYRRQFNEKTQQYANNPCHDWSSNGSDAFRYMAVVAGKARPKTIEPERLTGLHDGAKLGLDQMGDKIGYTLDQLWEDNEREDWRSRIIRI